MQVRYRHVHVDIDRHGNARVYFYKRGGRKVRLRAAPGTPEFADEYAAALAGAAPAPRSGPRRFASGTWGWLCRTYFAAAEYKSLAPRTQRVRRLILEATFEEPLRPGATDVFGDMPVPRLSAKAVRVLRDRKAETPEAANGRVKAIRQVMAWALGADHATSNPARDVPYLARRGDGLHSWTLDEVERFRARWPLGTRPRLALEMLLLTGVRRSDLVRLGRQHVRDGWLRVQVQKNRRRKPVTLELPVLPALADAIAQSPCGDLTFLVTKYGRPYTSDGFGNWFRRACRAANLEGCSAHGLRKAGAATAAENGASTHQLMAIFGWLTIKEAERYTRAARQRHLAGQAMHHLERREA